MESSTLEIHVLINVIPSTGSREYWNDFSIRKTITDQYSQALKGYIPSNIDCIVIMPGFHRLWDCSWVEGAMVAIAPFFDLNSYLQMSEAGKYHCMLDLIQQAVLQLADEYGWDKDAFMRAYGEMTVRFKEKDLQEFGY